MQDLLGEKLRAYYDQEAWELVPEGLGQLLKELEARSIEKNLVDVKRSHGTFESVSQQFYCCHPGTSCVWHLTDVPCRSCGRLGAGDLDEGMEAS